MLKHENYLVMKLREIMGSDFNFTSDDVVYGSITLTAALQSQNSRISAIETQTINANNIIGGYHIAATASAMNNIASALRPQGTLCYVVEDEKLYVRGASSWDELSIGGNGTLIPIEVSIDTELTPEQCSGSVIYVTGGCALTLPAVSGCEDGAAVTIYCETDDVVTIWPNAADRIRLEGVELTAGNGINSPGTAGVFVTLHKDSAAGTTSLGMYGVFVDAGPNI
jgi:hypothetical protein